MCGMISAEMRRIRNAAATWVLALGVAGCAPLAYRYDGQSYDTRAAAEAAAAADRAAHLARIEPLPAPLGGSVRIIVPSKAGALQRAVRRGTEEGRDYVASAMTANVRLWAEAILKRNIFARAEIEETDYPDHAAAPADGAVIYAYVAPDARAFAWYYRAPAKSRVPIDYDRGVVGADRLQSFISGVEARVREEGS